MIGAPVGVVYPSAGSHAADSFAAKEPLREILQPGGIAQQLLALVLWTSSVRCGKLLVGLGMPFALGSRVLGVPGGHRCCPCQPSGQRSRNVSIVSLACVCMFLA